MQVQVHNFSMAYRESGSGTPILFIHGFPLNSQLWEPQLSGLSNRARVLAPDLRGHGKSEPVPGPNWMDSLADDCAAFLDALGINQPVVVCGLSMGGYVAMAFHRQHGARIAGLILTDTRAGPDSEASKGKRDRDMTLAQEKGIEAIAEAMLPRLFARKTYKEKPELVDFAKSMMMNNSLEAILGDLMGMKERPDSYLTLAEIERPALIIRGEDDQIITNEEAEKIHKAISHSRLVIIPDAGHLPNLEQPDLFNQAIIQFLETI